MLLAIDVGNTHITLGVFEGDKLQATWDVATAIHRTPDEYAVLLTGLLREHGMDKAKIDKACAGLKIKDIKNIKQDLQDNPAQIAIVTVPPGAAQEVITRLVEAGVKAILNFAPARVAVPPEGWLTSACWRSWRGKASWLT